MIVQPALYIPPEIDARLMSGDLLRSGSVVRDLAGHIIKHLDEVPVPGNSREAMERIAASLKYPWAIAATALGAAVVVGGVAALVTWKRERSGKSELPELLEKYNASFVAYLEAVRDGKLDAGIIDQLISDLDAVKAHPDSGRIAIDSSTEQSETLVNLVVDYTRKLAEANPVELNELQDQASTSENDAIIDLRRHLEAQRRIFARAA